MKFLAVIATVIATAAAIEYPVFPFVWNDCSPPSADQTVTNFTLKPTFCPGMNYTVISTGLTSKDIIAPSKLQILGKYLGRIVYSDNQDLCALLAASGTPCPVAAGTAILSFDVLLKPTWPLNVSDMFRLCPQIQLVHCERRRC